MPSKPLFENPEITAMAEICQILQGLEDDAARLRVMRWSFARFGGEEFKRPLPVPPPAVQSSSPVTLSPQVLEPDHTPIAGHDDADAIARDFAGQVSELKDLFSRPANLVLNRLRTA